MQIRVCMAKIHRAVVTDASLNYTGSITLDPDLIEAAGIVPFQMVIINNLSNASTWQTYVVVGRKGKGDVILNGPPARLFQPGDLVVIVAEAYIEPSERKDLTTTLVFVDEKNKITKVTKHKHK